MKKIFAAIISFFLFFVLNAQTTGSNTIKVLSPVEGNWCNKQMLIIDNGEKGDYYYSLNGADPEAFGFAYDGPVLIDLTGEITLRIKKIDKRKTEKKIVFTVHQDEGLNTTYKSFIDTFYDSGIYNYTSGTELEIPEDLMYSFGLPPDSYIQGQRLVISEKSVLIRYIPCVLYDKLSYKKWRFVIKTFPQNAGAYSRRDVPFTITDWDTITFVDQNLIYKVDSEYWGLPKEPRKISRNTSHMISWQSIDYEFGNPIEYFVLPPKPELVKSEDSSGAIIYSFDGDNSYSFSVLSDSDYDYQELYKTLGIDTFYGDNAQGEVEVGIFSNAVYQGKTKISYGINKRPPAQPEIKSTAQSFYSRTPVKVILTGESGSDLYISTSYPYFVKDTSSTYSPNDKVFNQVKMSDWKKSDSNTIQLLFEPQGEGAAYYKIRAYSVNGKNKGSIAEYSVIIDQYNYYFNEAADPSLADGTADRPYTSFLQCVESVNNGRYARLRVKGPIKMPDEQITFLSNCEIVNDGNAVLLFGKDSSIVVKNASFSIDGCRIEADYSSDKAFNKSSRIIKLENAVLDITNCQISTQFGRNGTFIDSYNSAIKMSKNIVAISAKVYASFVSGVKTKLSLRDSSVNLTSETSVGLSLNEGDVNLKNNSFKVIGQKGRAAELFSVRGTISDNSFKAELKKTENADPVFKDAGSSVKEQNNEYFGF